MVFTRPGDAMFYTSFGLELVETGIHSCTLVSALVGWTGADIVGDAIPSCE